MLDLEPIKKRMKDMQLIRTVEDADDIAALIQEVEELREKVKDLEEMCSNWAGKHFDVSQKSIMCVEVKLGNGKIITVRGD